MLNGNNYGVTHQILKLLSKIMYIKCLAHDLMYNRSMKSVSIKNHFSFYYIAIKCLSKLLP